MIIGIIGQGAWGVALASSFKAAGKTILVHTRSTPLTNAQFASLDYVLLTTPAQKLDSYLTSLKNLLPVNATFVICAKGIELKTHQLLSDIVEKTLGESAKIAVLSGPNFAHEIVAGLPAAATLAAANNAAKIAQDLGTENLRLYATDDIIGVQIGGALKNVIALACGMVIGAGFGENARAALLTRGLNEMVRMAEIFGGRPDTLMGMSGFGDLVLSATSQSSRNYNLGFLIGQQGFAATVLANSTKLTEGVDTAKAVADIAVRNNLDLPVFKAVFDVLVNNHTVKTMAQNLMQRPQKPETLS